VTTTNRIMCTRCGRHPALSERNAGVRFAKNAGLLPEAPIAPPGICIECLLKDPELLRPVRARWSEVAARGKQGVRESFRKLRALIARSLEVIDRFVGSRR